jgi:hypothetical protein
MLIFISMFLYLTSLRILSTSKVDARKTVRALLSEFVNDKETIVKIIRYNGSQIIQTTDIKQGKEYVADLETILYKYTTKVEWLNGDYKPFKEGIRISIENSKNKITLDFPTGATEFQTVIVITKWSGNNSIFHISKVGEQKIKSLLVK